MPGPPTTSRSHRQDWLYWLAALLIAIGFTASAARHITDERLHSDAAHNLTVSFNLFNSGIYSFDTDPTRELRPRMRREPFPPTVYAAYMAVHPSFDTKFELDDIINGRLTQDIKYVNLGFAFILFFSVFSLGRQFFGSGVIALSFSATTCFLIYGFYVTRPEILDRLMTELPASALLALATTLLVSFTRTRSYPTAFAAGCVLGCLILTKAAFLYVAFAFIFTMAILDVLRMRQDQNVARPARILVSHLVIILGLACSILPWMTRNYILIGDFSITARGGDVLAYRALIMEYPLAGATFVYSPELFRPAIGRLTGYDEKDLLDPDSIGLLNRNLNDNLAKRRWDIYRERMEEAGFEYPGMRASEPWLQGQAVEQFRSDLPRYLASIPVFYYRAMWGVFVHPNGGEITAFGRAIPQALGTTLALATHLSLWVILLTSLVRRDPTLFAIVGGACGWLLFHAMVTHNIPRYSVLVAPIQFAVLVGCLFWILARVGAGPRSV
jgi:hypothetical protein